MEVPAGWWLAAALEVLTWAALVGQAGRWEAGSGAPWLAALRPLNTRKLCGTGAPYSALGRQWPEVSDFVARFCTLRESKKHTDMRESHTFQRAKKCDTNHILRATAYGAALHLLSES